MSDNRAKNATGTKGQGIGVSGYCPPRRTYVPALHNPTNPVRPGSEDAFNHPSMGMDGILRPYWGNK